MNYQPYYNPYGAPDYRAQYMTPAAPATTQNVDERIWVQGEGAAQAYLVSPNSFVRLWDSLRPVFYEKRADSSGRPYMDVYEYKRRDAQTPGEAVLPVGGGIDYGEEIKALKARIEALEGKNNDE